MHERKMIYLDDAIDVLEERLQANGYSNTVLVSELNRSIGYLMQLTPAQPEEVIPHQNYKYLSDYWCECGWHLGKYGEVKYCAECGRKVKWDE